MEATSEAPWLVPLPRPYSFVGRETQLAQLISCASSEGVRIAVYGLGGCGKTALALEAAYRIREQQPKCAVFWVPAVTQQSFEQAYRDIGLLLRIPGIEDAKADAKQLVKTKLSNEGFGHWLMIVDNADEVEILFGTLDERKRTDRLFDCLPYSRKGSIIFTTRTARAASDLAQSNVIELGELGKTEATELLRTRLFPKHRKQVEEEALANEFLHMMSYLALAIVQAAAFINRNDIQISKYILLYRASQEEAMKLLNNEFEDNGRYRSARNSVATTWYISFEQIRERNKRAADYLSFMSCIANNNIPEPLLLSEGSQVEHVEAIGTLKAYAFVTEREATIDWKQGQEGPTERLTAVFDIHPLVHLTMQGWLKARHRWFPWAKYATKRLLNIIISADSQGKKESIMYLLHARHLADIPEANKDQGTMMLLSWIGSQETMSGRYKDAERSFRRLLERKTMSLGKQHPETLDGMNSLASALERLGRHADAEEISREALRLSMNELGDKNPITLQAMALLAQELSNQNKYVQAELVLRERAELCKAVSSTGNGAVSEGNSLIAKVLIKQGRYAEAEEIYQETLKLPETTGLARTFVMSDLAFVLSKQDGKSADAVKVYRDALVCCQNHLGKESQFTISKMNLLALQLAKDTQDDSRIEEAEKILREAVILSKKELGSEHLDTINYMYSLAAIIGLQNGRLAEVEKVLREALELREKVSGEAFPSALDIINYLVRILRKQGKCEEATRFEDQIELRGREQE